MIVYHCCPISLQTDSIILPGNWGRLVQRHGLDHQCWARESTLEYIRQKHYPDKPSRLNCSYSMETLETARYYQQVIAPDCLLYEVELISPSYPKHIGNFACLEPIRGRLEKSLTEIAHHYWNADWWEPLSAAPQIKTSEILTHSPLRIIKMVEPE